MKIKLFIFAMGLLMMAAINSCSPKSQQNPASGQTDNEGSETVNKTNDDGDFLIRVQDEKGKWGFIDKTGKEVIPCTWMQDDNEKWGFIDKTGKEVIPCKWEDAKDFSEGLVSVMDTNGKYGFIDKTGKVVIPCTWQDAEDFSEGLARVMDTNGKYGFIDKTGKVVMPCTWEEAEDFSEGLCRTTMKSGASSTRPERRSYHANGRMPRISPKVWLL